MRPRLTVLEVAVLLVWIWVWILLIVLVALLGVLCFAVARGDKMKEHEAAA